MTQPKVTVWLSTYNQAPYVAQALDSILMQKTDFPFEVVAADDCSTDDTQKIILEYQARFPDKIVTYFPNPNVGGCRKLCDCIDKGLFRGDYLAYLEGDDYWLGEDRLQTLVDFLEAHPEYSRVAHQRVLVDENGIEFGPDIPPDLLEKVFTIKDFLQGRDYSDFGSVFRNYFKYVGDRYHELFLASRNVCDFQDMFITQDFGPVFLIKECFGAYRCKRSSSASNYNTVTTPSYRSKDLIHICEAVGNFYKGRYDFSPLLEKCRRRILICAVEDCSEEELIDARSYVSKAEIRRFLPEIYFENLRKQNKKAMSFIRSCFSSYEKGLLVLRAGLYGIGRLLNKKKHIRTDNVRGYILQDANQDL